MARRCPLVVGGPVHRRHWCLERWFDSLEAQDPPDGTRLLFMLSEEGDPSERVILRRWPGAEVLYAPPGLPCFAEDEKEDSRRYAVLAELRNRLLKAVGGIAPERYLSWDSDILLESGALRALRDVPKDAVGALVDMGGDVMPGRWSWMHLSGRDAFRPEPQWPVPVPAWTDPLDAGAVPVGVIMGAKLLSERAYRSTRYADHVLGEDVGWALCAEAVGIERWVCPAARGTHLYQLEATPA